MESWRSPAPVVRGLRHHTGYIAPGDSVPSDSSITPYMITSTRSNCPPVGSRHQGVALVAGAAGAVLGALCGYVRASASSASNTVFAVRSAPLGTGHARVDRTVPQQLCDLVSRESTHLHSAPHVRCKLGLRAQRGEYAERHGAAEPLLDVIALPHPGAGSRAYPVEMPIAQLGREGPTAAPPRARNCSGLSLVMTTPFAVRRLVDGGGELNSGPE